MRHILGLSGGKDSTALAIHIRNTRPEIFEQLELFFTDTGVELPEIYEYLDCIERYLGKPILRLKADPGADRGFSVVNGQDESIPFDTLLGMWNGFLPSPMARWCTRKLKIDPMEKWIGGDECVSYVGIRVDEPEREGYVVSNRTNISPCYPFREDDIDINGVYRILDESIGLPDYYKWRTRSGCYFCFYQRRVEWAIMYYLHPELFELARKYESEHADGRLYTWVKDKPLEYVAQNAVEIIGRYVRKQYAKLADKTRVRHTPDAIIELARAGRIKEVVDSGDIKTLHDVDGENKEGCTVCAI